MDRDYTVSYADNVELGTATVTITAVAGSGYVGTGSTTFQINENGYLHQGTIDGCDWWVDGDGTLVIAKSQGGTGKLPTTYYSEFDEDETPSPTIFSTFWPWLSHANKIKSAKIQQGVTTRGGIACMFYGLNNMVEADLSGMDASQARDLSGLFRDCSSLVSIDLTAFEKSTLNDMDSMFQGCSSLVSLDMSVVDTSKVTGMNYVFQDCSSLKTIDLSGKFDTSHVQWMSDMFRGCSSLESIDTSCISTLRARITNGMFADCTSLKSLDLSTLRMKYVENSGGMFDGCTSLETLKLGEVATASGQALATKRIGHSLARMAASEITARLQEDAEPSLTYTARMFAGCSSIRTLDLTDFDTSCVTDMTSMFDGCASLESVDLSTFDTHAVENSWGMFNGCDALRTIKVGTGYQIKDDTMFPATGGESAMWRSTIEDKLFVRTDIVAQRSQMADTYTLESLESLDSAEIIAVEDFEYNGKDQTQIPTVMLDGNQLAAETDYDVTGATQRNAGTYELTVTGKGDFTGSKTVTYRIMPREVTVTVLDAMKHEGEEDPKLAATITGLLGDDTIEYTLSREDGEDVGTYKIMAQGKTKQGNYKVAYEGAEFTIVPAERNDEDGQPNGIADETTINDIPAGGNDTDGPNAPETSGSGSGSDGVGHSGEPHSNQDVRTSVLPHVMYRTHVEQQGWRGQARDGRTAGTTGKSLRIEAMELALSTDAFGSIEYRAHVQDIGWEHEWQCDGDMVGTIGESLRLEAIQIRLTDRLAEVCDVWYRVHCQDVGWLDWAKNGTTAGTTGYAYRMEAIQVCLLPKGSDAPGPTSTPAMQKIVSYSSHIQNIGWQPYVDEGATSGTTGQSLRMEGVRIRLANPDHAGSIEYCMHVQNDDWQDYVTANKPSGTTGRSLRAEAIRIRLTGEMQEHYDVWYRVHCQDIGWMDWAKNDEPAGTEGKSLRMEALEIRLIPKGGTAPGSTQEAYRKS